LLNATSNDELNLDDYDFQYNCGIAMNVAIEKREEFVKAIAYHYVINANMAALSQFRKGLMETLEFKRLATRNSTMVWSLLAASERPKKLKCIEVQDLFTVLYSPIGSNNRQREEASIMYFYTFLQECEGKQVYYRRFILFYLNGMIGCMQKFFVKVNATIAI